MHVSGLLLLAAAASVSSLSVRTHTAAPLCIDLHCPAIALDLGEQNLINEETFSKEQCESCAQCTNHGYSVCLRVASAARSPGTRRCSCAHSTPANCHNEVMPASQRPVNITMSLFNVCYLSSIQSPPKPLAKQEKNSVIATVESFWTEPYWKTLELENLTLHYEYIVQSPEQCDGELRTAEGPLGSAPTHTCTSQIPIAMSGAGAEGGQKAVSDDYEHSEGYDAYDDELPPEVQFDREVFHHAKEVKFFYRVAVRRPRQLTKESTSDPFRDVTTEVDSEMFHYELRPYKKNDAKDDEAKADNAEDGGSDEEDFPEETDFFAGDKKEDEARKKLRDNAEADKARLHVTGSHHHDDEADEKDKNVITSDNAEVVVSEGDNESTTAATSAEKEVEAKSGEKDDKEEEGDGWEEAHPTSDEAITEDLLAEHSMNSTEVHSGSTNSTDAATDDEEDDEEDDVTSTLEPSESAEIEKEIEEEDGETSAEATTPEDGDEDEEEATTSSEPADDDVEKSEDEAAGGITDVKSLFAYFSPSDKWGLARLVFGTTLALCFLIIAITCCCKRDVICGKPATKTAGGYTYNAASQQTRPLVVEPSREPLNQ